MAAYYNEWDKKSASWLRELIKAGLIADGEVDERSIADVQAGDIRGFNQCHWFAGIGGWSYALRLAGVTDDYPVWTGSCPCQPFSTAGKNNGKSDERHLWPEFARLIAEVRPVTVFGEQVEGAVKHGWLDDLQADMERENYTVGAAVLGAHSVQAYHQRQRLYWVADSNDKRLEERQGAERTNQLPIRANGLVDGLGNSNSDRRPAGCETAEAARYRNTADSAGWANPDWIECRDNRLRPIKPGIKCMADGVPARVVRLRGYGNAIVPQVAAEFISAFYEVFS